MPEVTDEIEEDEPTRVIFRYGKSARSEAQSVESTDLAQYLRRMRSEDMEPGEERAKVYGTERIALFEGLQGRRITGWQGTDRLTGPGGSHEPELQDPSLPCLNLSNLFASLDADDSAHIFVVEMGGDNWTSALSIDNDAHPAGWEISGASRGREPLGLPTGIVEIVDVRLEDEVIAEVALRIGGVEMLLIPGDLDEDGDNPQVWRRFDENVLAFADASDADRIDWAPPRNP